MKDMGIVYGSLESAQPLVIDCDTVYIHSDIYEKEIDTIRGKSKLYSYHEIQYDKDEYIRLQFEQMEHMQSAIDYLLMNSGGE